MLSLRSIYIAISAAGLVSASQCCFKDGEVISLRADTGKFLGRCNNCVDGAYPDSAFVHVPQTKDAPWANWKVFNAGNGKIALQADTGRFLARCNKCAPSATSPDEAFVHVNDWQNASWAQWTCEDVGNGSIGLKSDTGRYLARCNSCNRGAYPDTGMVHAKSYADGSWAQWTIMSNGQISSDRCAAPTSAPTTTPKPPCTTTSPPVTTTPAPATYATVAPATTTLSPATYATVTPVPVTTTPAPVTTTPAYAYGVFSDCATKVCKIRLKSWKNDYLHRPDTAQGVTTWSTGIGNEWTVELRQEGKIALKSWKGDYLHRPDSGQGVTTWNTGIGNEWSVVMLAGNNKISLRSWKHDFLHRPDSNQGVTTWSTGIGNEWTAERI